MKIAATVPGTPFRPNQRTLFVPDSATTIAPSHVRELVKAASIVAGKNLGGVVVADTAWKLTTVPHAMTQQELTALLTSNNVAPAKAPDFARDIQGLLSHPLARTVLFGISGGAIVYLVVEKTKWSRRAKWGTTIIGGVLCAVLYLLLRHLDYMK